MKLTNLLKTNIMKKCLLIIIFFIFLLSPLFSQNPIIWKKTYSSVYKRTVIDLLIIDTSYYILCDKTQNFADIELLNTNKSNGSLNFSKTYSGQSNDNPYKLYQTNSSLFIFGVTTSQEGIFDNNHGAKDGFSIKTNLNGDIIDTNFWGGSLGENVITSKISFNKYISVGSSNSIDGDLISCSNTGTYRQWLYSHDSLGNILNSICNDTIIQSWGDFFFQNGHYYFISSGTVTQTGGYTYPYYSTNGNWQGYSQDFLVIQYDTSFNIQNIKNYGSDSQEKVYKSIRTSDNGFMLFGYTDFIHDTLEVSGGIGGRDLYCVKLDSNANFQWSKCLGSMGSDSPKDIVQSSDNGYFILGQIQQASGNVSHSFGQQDIWLAKIDSIGNLLWERTYGGSYNDWGNVIREDSDATIIISGTTSSTDGTFSGMSIQGNSDMFIIKLAPWVGISESEKTQINISVYPNPTYSGGSINLRGLSPVIINYQLSIYNLQGQAVHFENFSAANRKRVQLPQLADGMYFIRLQNTEGHVSNAKFIVN